MNIPKNVQEYINSLPPNQQKAAMNEILRNQYSAYKNSPNQVNQQNMKTSIAPQATKSPELALPSKYSQEKVQESGNLQGNLQDMLVQYFEKMQFTEKQAKQFMQDFAKLSDEEKQQLIQELQQELQGDSMPEQSQEMPEEEMEEPVQEQPKGMMSGGRFPYMLKKKSKEKLQIGGFPAEKAKAIKDSAKEIRDIEAKRQEEASIKAANDAIIAASNKTSVVSNTSPTTPIATAPTLGKKIIRLDDGKTNDYYEVDVDSSGKPLFDTKIKLDDVKRKDYNSKYIFEEPSIVATKPVLDAPTSVTTINKKGNTPATSPVNNPTDSTKTAIDSSFINKMFKDTLGVTIDTTKLQKPASKKVITAPPAPPSINRGTDTNEGITSAQRQAEKAVDVPRRRLTGYEEVDRFQDNVSALSTAASLTGVGGLPAKVVDIADAALDAGQFAYAYATGNKPEMRNQGIQTGMRVVFPLAARGAGKAIQKYSPAAEEIGYRIGKSKVGEKIIAPIFNKNNMSKYNTVGVQVIKDMQKAPGYMSRIDDDVVKAGKEAQEFMKKVNKKTNPAEVAQAKSALKRYEDALLASNKKDITEMEAMRREMAGQKFNKAVASKQVTYKQASAVKAVEEAKIPKLNTDGLGTEWKWQGEGTAKLIAEQEALLAKARTLPEVKRINEQLKKLYKSKVVYLKPVKVPKTKKQFGGYYFM